jgi:superfamily II DNA or RNA helicase
MISLWISEKLNNNKIIIGVPNIELLEQLEFDVIDMFPNHYILKVQSAIKMETIKNTIINNDKIIILTTYASSYKIKKCCDCLFDIKTCDETHHLTTLYMDVSQETKNFVEFLKINSTKQLALTATLKDIENIDSNDKIISNKNEIFFGKIILKYSLLWAINKNIICDYQIQTLIYNDDLVNEYFTRFGLDDPIDIRLFLSSYSSLKSICSKNSHHLLIYSNNKENAKKIIFYIGELITKKIFKIDNLYFSEYNSDIGKSERVNIINNYNNNQFGIISCVMCLAEGYNNKLIDGVIFSENMTSNIRIVQSAMRSNRKNSNEPNKISKIILPILNKNNWIDDKNNNDLQKIKEIIYHMSLEDETIEHKIKAYKIKVEKFNDDDDNKNIVNLTTTYGELNENITKEILIKSIDRVKLGITYEKVKKTNTENNIKNKLEYFKLCEKNIRLPKDPEYFFGQQFKNWVDFLGIPKIYYDISTCKQKVNDYLKNNLIKINNTYDNNKICSELCIHDDNFPPDGLWVDYYSDDKINNLGEIIKSNISKKKNYSSLI